MPVFCAVAPRLQRGRVVRDAEAVERLLAVRADQALRQYQIRQIGFADFGQDLIGIHIFTPLGWLTLRVGMRCIVKIG